MSPSFSVSPSAILKFSLALIVIFTMASVFSCSLLPDSQQFVTAASQTGHTRTAGNCNDVEIFPHQIITGNALDPESISVLDWNIYKMKKEGLGEDLRKLSENADILLLQEAVFDTELYTFFNSRQPFWNFNSSFSYQNSETGVLTASVIKPVFSCGQRSFEPLTGLPKTAIISMFPISGSTSRLMVVNIHAINFTLGTASYSQQFGELLPLLKNHDGPVILAGDFNDWSDKRSAVIDRIRQDLSLNTLEFSDDARTRFFGKPVDHILYRGLEPIQQTTVKTTSSDHNPLSVTFRTSDSVNPAISSLSLN